MRIDAIRCDSMRFGSNTPCNTPRDSMRFDAIRCDSMQHAESRRIASNRVESHRIAGRVARRVGSESHRIASIRIQHFSHGLKKRGIILISGLGNLDACPWLEFVPLKLFNGASSLFIKVYRCTVYKSGRLTAAATTFNQISEPMTIVMLMMMVMHAWG